MFDPCENLRSALQDIADSGGYNPEAYHDEDSFFDPMDAAGGNFDDAYELGVLRGLYLAAERAKKGLKDAEVT